MIKRRSESFWGIHMDFHAFAEVSPVTIGATLKEEDIREICRRLKPDYIQIDCKGHPGWASYPTALGNAMPDFALDPLAMWRRVTKEEGVALYMHYSGLYERRYGTEHPEDCVINAEGKTEISQIKADGAYADKLLIPQLLELAGKYGVDGVWIDGDSWYTFADYAPASIAQFEKQTGIQLNGQLPVKKGDPYFEEFREYSREKYRAYLRHYVDAIHAQYPDFQIASNWAFTDLMPEKVSANVDFLSGDLNPANCFNSARYAGRVIAAQNMVWDLMAWNFRFKAYGGNIMLPKHPVQLMQDAAAVIALGGAFQDYVLQFKDGSPDRVQLLELESVARFVRAREPFCFHGKIVPQVQMLMSTYDRENELPGLFGRDGMDRLLGLTALLCDAGQSLEIVMEHSIDFKSPVIVIPELYEGLTEEIADKLVAYVRDGGNLVIVGKKANAFFKDRFGYATEAVAPIDRPNYVLANSDLQSGLDSEVDAAYFTVDGTHFGGVGSPETIVYENGEEIAALYRDFREKLGTFAAIIPFGKGKVAPIGADIGDQYRLGEQFTARDLIDSIMRRLYSPIARIEKQVGKTEIVCLRKDGKLMLQLINANGNHSSGSSLTEDSIPPVVDLTVSLDSIPNELVLWPEGKSIAFREENGRAVFDLPRLDLHEIVEIR